MEYEEVDEFGDRTNDTVEEDFTGGPVEYVERTGGVDIYKTADGKYSATVRGKSLTADTVDGLKAKLAGKDEEDRKHLDSLPEDYDKDAGKIAKFIEDAVNGLKNGEATNYRYKLDDRFAIFVGWSDGYSEDDNTVIHNSENPTEGITAGIKVWTSDDMWTDFDYLNAPYYEGGEVLSDELSIDTIVKRELMRTLGYNFTNDTKLKDGTIMWSNLDETVHDLTDSDIEMVQYCYDGKVVASTQKSKKFDIYYFKKQPVISKKETHDNEIDFTNC